MTAAFFRKMKFVLAGLVIFTLQPARAQDRPNGQNSETLISYDYTAPESKTTLPFDKYFTFQILHFNTQNIEEIKVYEASFINGVRSFKIDNIVGGKKTSAFDFKVEDYKIKHDTLLLYFLPIKPDKDFDIVIKRALTNNNFSLLTQLNEAIFAGKTDLECKTILDKLRKGALDPNSKNITSFPIKDFTTYKDKFTTAFQPFFNHLQTQRNFPSVTFLTIEQLNLMDAGYTEKGIKFKWGYVPARIVTEGTFDDIFGGYLPADYNSGTARADAVDDKARVANLDRSIALMDTIYRNLNTFLFKENDRAFETMRVRLQDVIRQLKVNRGFVNSEIAGLNDAIQNDKDLMETEMLVGSSQATDLQTKGTNIFTLDLGVATLGAWNAQNRFILLPKFYYGINIYFRPINKNTRLETLPSDLPANRDTGPDYNIVSQKSIWQHLSMTVGLTTGSYNDKDFGNLYSNTSLLVGGGYRFYRAFKVTAGAGFLRRTSNNPVIVNQVVCVSPFVSFSADIDFISTIKSVISPALWN